ncbi:MAG: cobalamin-binding protein [Dehalococcoidales bacterium]|nr:cobalamin-binding protein [Dehalococcoidales bacterium]
MASYEELQESVITGQKDKVEGIANSLLDGGIKPREIIPKGLLPGMSVVGQRFKTGEMFIPEVIASAAAMNRGLEILKPLIVGNELSDMSAGKVVIGTVQGDVHNIGKSLVGMMMESGGFTVMDIGIDVPADKFVEAVEEEKPNILGLSALLTTTIPLMKDVIEALKRSNLRDKVHVMVGGAPITQEFADSIGADAYAADAVSAVDKAKQLMS